MALKALAGALEGIEAAADSEDSPRGQDLQASLDAAITEYTASAREADPETLARDTALASELAYGVCRLKGRLDYLLGRFLRDPGKLPPGLVRILEVAAYELTQLDAVPAYATVSWAVDGARAGFSEGLAKLANGVLRNLQRLLDNDPDAVRNPDFYRQDNPAEAEFLARWYAAPVWLVELWTAAYGLEQARAYLEAQLAAPPLGLRLNPLHPDFPALSSKLCMHPGAVFLQDLAVALAPGAEFDPVPGEKSGALSRQSAAAQAILHELDASELAAPVWDCCAGRGGKSFWLAEHELAPVLASDVHAGRLHGLVSEKTRLGSGHERVFAVRARADVPAPLLHPVPSIVVDAPCSGLGVLSRRPDSKWKRRPADLADLVRLQRAILEHTSKALAPGGALVYITCTLNPAENEELVAGFLAEHPEFALEHSAATPPDSPLREFFWGARLRKRG